MSDVRVILGEIRQLKEILHGDELWNLSYEGGEAGPFETVSEEQVDSGRWMSYHEVIVKSKTDHYYRYQLAKGLTEYQEVDNTMQSFRVQQVTPIRKQVWVTEYQTGWTEKTANEALAAL